MSKTTHTHILRGTCQKGCPDYGRCHCGCGDKTNIAGRTNSQKFITGGQPFVYLFRHRSGQSRQGVYTPVTGRGETVPTAPLRAYMRQQWSPVYEDEKMPFARMQRDISQRAGVTQRQVARWQKSIMQDEQIALEIADVVCAGLGVPMSYIYR